VLQLCFHTYFIIDFHFQNEHLYFGVMNSIRHQLGGKAGFLRYDPDVTLKGRGSGAAVARGTAALFFAHETQHVFSSHELSLRQRRDCSKWNRFTAKC
jgi:hypothetical protein